MFLSSILMAAAIGSPHFYTWHGQRVPVVPSPSALVVEVSADTNAEMLAREVGVPLWQVAQPGNRHVLTLEVPQRDHARVRAQLESRPDFVGWLMPLRSAGTNIDEIVDRRVLVRFRASVDRAEVERLGAKLRYSVERTFAHPANAFRLEVASAEAALTIADTLVNDSRVVWAEPERWARPRLFMPVVHDDFFADQWHLFAPADHGINAADAWDTTSGDAAVVIAVIDTGVEMAHPEFAGKLVHPYDAFDDDTDPTPGSSLVDGHGTAVAGIVAAPMNAGGAERGAVVGVCPDCSIMPIRLGPGDGLWPLSVVASALNHAADNGANVINNSWGFGGFYLPELVYEAMQGAIDGGATVLFASGNDPVEMFPNDLVGHPNVLAIGGVSYLGEHISYASFGPALDLVAPTMELDASSILGCPDGPGIHTTDDTGDKGFNPQMDEIFMSDGFLGCGAACNVTSTDYTCFFSGTSAACPVAAGAAGLLLSHRSDLTAGQVRWVLTQTAEKVGSSAYDANGWNQEMGYGRPDLVAALAQIDDISMCEPAAENCGDAVDNDCDGLIDADDLDCGAVFPPPLDFSRWGATCTPAESLSGRPGVNITSCGPDLPCAPLGGGFQQPTTGACVHMCVDECAAGYSCASYTSGGLMGEQTLSYCLQQCAGPSDCPSGWLCGTTAGLAESVCVKSCSSAQECLSGVECASSYGACGATSIISTQSDGGPQDGGPQGDDGGPQGDTTTIAPSNPRTSPDDEGCGCRSTPGSAWLLLLLAGQVLYSRRRAAVAE